MAVDPKYGSFAVSYKEKTNGVQKSTDVTYEPCQKKDFKHGKVPDDFFYCVQESAFEIQGAYSSDNFKYLEVQFNPCERGGNVTCANAIQ